MHWIESLAIALGGIGALIFWGRNLAAVPNVGVDTVMCYTVGVLLVGLAYVSFVRRRLEQRISALEDRVGGHQ